MVNIPVTPINRAVRADGTTRTITFPGPEEWIFVDRGIARQKSSNPDSIWNPKMPERIEEFEKGECVEDLTNGMQMRIGCVAGLRIKDYGSVFIRFSETHPTRARMLTTPSGLPETTNFRSQTLDELGEETILVNEETNEVGFMEVDGKILSEQHVRRFAANNGFTVNKALIMKIVPFKGDYPKKTTFVFGDEIIEGLVAWEADTGAAEVTALYYAELPPQTKLVDGEFIETDENGNGFDRHSEIVYGSELSDIDRETMLTTKAQIMIEAFGN